MGAAQAAPDAKARGCDVGSAMDFRRQRVNMVESQVRPSDVTDQRIIRAMLEVPRERFVPPEVAAIAYIDDPVPVTPRNGGRTPASVRHLLPARTLAKLLQLAEIGPESKVLVVGCATGYSAAVLSRLAGKVVALEAERSLAETATKTLQELGAGNVEVVEGPLGAGAPGESRFDAILVDGAVPAVPPALLDQLADGGRLVAVLSEGAVSRAQVWQRNGTTVDWQPAFEAAAGPLPGFEKPVAFVF
jgi:protein-L-isoaspartate(D-aspartate) O-methyltransferase